MHVLSQLVNRSLSFIFVLFLYNAALYGSNKINEEDTLEYISSIIVSIRYDCKYRSDPLTHCCSGTILTESYILTTANCINTLSTDISTANMTIVTAAAAADNKYDLSPINRKVDEIIIHPNWEYRQKKSINDIAILHLSTPLDFTIDKYLPRIHRLMSLNLSKNAQLVTVQWNPTAYPNLQVNKLSAQNNNNTICDKLISNFERQFCIELYYDNQESCNHQSGEAIFQWIDNRWMQIGLLNSVTARSNTSCLGVYTRLAYYNEWIESILNMNLRKSPTFTKQDHRNTRSRITYRCNPLTTSCGCSRESVELSSEETITSEEVIPLSWSMVVSVRLNNSNEHSCSGTILTPFYILTSAYCVDGAGELEVSVAAGLHNRVLDFAMIRYAHDIYIHPHWNKSDDTYRNDIAILHLFPPLSIPGGFGLAETCVSYTASKNDSIQYPFVGSHSVIVGWGSIGYESNQLSETLQQASLSIIDSDDPKCQNSIHDKEKQFCASTYGKGSCQGDAGGPIFQWKNHYWEQVGIMSYAASCNDDNVTSVYTRLAYYFDWIESIINISLTTTSTKPPPTPISYACNKASKCGCGMSDVSLLSSRIVGGTNAIENSWPMIVSVRLNNSQDHSCGGTILSNSYILTVAHCFRQISSTTPTGISIAAGMLNRSDPLQIIRNVDRLYIHPNFSNLPNEYHHDIALLHIDRPFVFGSYLNLTKTCIHHIEPPISINQYPKAGTRLAVIGWGYLRYQFPFIPEILQQIEVFAIDNEDPICLNSINDTEYLFCAGLSEGGKDACQGDSGGPILQWTGHYWEQVGIVSHGKECALPGFPTLYTRLSQYYDWIENILQLDGEYLEPTIPERTTTNIFETTTRNIAYSCKFNILMFVSFIILLRPYSI